ncbi:MAG TPA: hypothetical protein VLC53_04515, partial [Myxococcota bacterium]|nr:hypothetical protein [Myxococcota bacterium]
MPGRPIERVIAGALIVEPRPEPVALIHEADVDELVPQVLRVPPRAAQQPRRLRVRDPEAPVGAPHPLRREQPLEQPHRLGPELGLERVDRLAQVVRPDPA